MANRLDSDDDCAAEHITVRDAGGVRTVTLNRPAKANALTARMVARLWAVWQEFDRDPTLRVLLLTATGAAFCGGRDLGELGRAKDSDAALMETVRPRGAP